MCYKGVTLHRTICILGYSLLPMVILSLLSLLFPMILNYKTLNLVNLILSWLIIIWSTSSAAKMFANLLEMNKQKYLIAYPVFLLYSAFAILTIF